MLHAAANKSMLCAVDNVQVVIDDSREWHSKTLMIEVASSLEDNKIIELNLVSTFGVNTRVSKKQLELGLNKHWLPSHFDSDDRETRLGALCRHFSVPALLSGFALRVRRYRDSNLYFECERGRGFESRKDGDSLVNLAQVSDQRVPTTAKAISGLSQRCPFRFYIGWSVFHRRWFIPHSQMGCANHLGHLKLPTPICNARAVDMSDSEQELHTDVAQSGSVFSSHERLLHKRNQITLSRGKLQYLRQQAKELRFNAAVTCVVGAEAVNLKNVKNPTPADKLLAEFDSNTDISYVALIAEFNTDKLTIKKKRKRKGQHHLDDVEASSLKDHCGGASQTAKLMNYTARQMRIRKNLQVGPDEDQVILLAFAWTTKQAKLRMEMFAELCVADVVHGTNKEERGLLVFSGMDSHNKTHSFTWIYVPAESRWVFRWAIRDVLPALHSERVLKKMRILITDQDGQLMLAISDLMRDNNSWLTSGKLVYRNCAWHKLNRNLTDHKDFHGLVALLNDEAMLEWNALVSWLWHIVRRPETIYETNLLFILLELYIEKDTKLPDELKRRFIDFVGKKFQEEQHKYCAHNFVDVMHFEKTTTNAGEVENSALKGHGYAPGPLDGLDVAAEKVKARTDQRFRHKQVTASRENVTVPSKEVDRKNTVAGIARVASNKLMKAHSVSSHFDRYRVSDYECYVRFRRSDAKPLARGGSITVLFF